MEYNYTNRVSLLKASTIREMLKAQGPDIISFSAGSPNPEAFPAEELKTLANTIFDETPALALQYGITEGYTPLRELTKTRLSENLNIDIQKNDLIITSGGQQGIELSAKMLLNEGDTVICEEPTFIGALNAFRSYSANIKGVSVDSCGLDLNAVENILKTDKRVKFIYTIPTFQNPTGVTMSFSRRKELLALAVKYNILILEDNPYHELRYSGEAIPPVKSLDTTGHVIYLGSYSKIIAPGIRIGYVCADSEFLARMTVLKQISDVHTNQFFQILVAKYISECNLDGHIAHCRKLGGMKLSRMLDCIDNVFPEIVKTTRPEGGLFIWCSLPDGMDSKKFAALALNKKVIVVNGSTFLTDESAVSNGFRINFTMPSIDQIDLGITILGDALREFLR